MSNITAQDILDLLPIVAGRGWRRKRIPGFDVVLRDRDGRCPICALVYETTGVDSKLMADKAWERGGYPLNFDAVHRIVCAADYQGDKLRPALMAALGMKP